MREHTLRSCRLLMWSLWVTFSLTSNAQHIGLPAMKTFTIDDYAGGGQNYQVAQTKSGVICVANNLGLLTFDGSYWNRYGIAGGTKVRSVLPVDERIYVGGQNEFGYFYPSERGFLQYESLTHLVPEGEGNFEDTWRIHEIDGILYFSASGKTFVYDGQSIHVVRSSDTPGFTVEYDDLLLTKDSNKPIQYYSDTTWTPLYPQPNLAGRSLVSAIKLSESESLWFTRSDGIFRFDGTRSRPFARSLTTRLAKDGITTVQLLRDGVLAIGTDLGGLYLVDSRSGKEILQIDVDKGLISRTVYDLHEDRTGALWLSMNNAIVKISWSYPFSFINEEIGLPGTGYTALAVGHTLYLGTSNGLYTTDISQGSVDRVTRINGINGQINYLQEINGHVLISAHEGAFVLEGGQVRAIDQSTGWWGFVALEDPNKLIAGAYDGLGLFAKADGQWQLVRRYQNFSESSRVLVYAGDSVLWMTHGYKGVYRFRFTGDYDSLRRVDYFGGGNGLPSPYLNNVFGIGEEIVFTAENGVFHFDTSKNQFERHPYLDTLIGPGVHTRFMRASGTGNIFAMTTDFTGLLTSNPWKGITIEKNTFDGIHSLLNDDLAQISVIADNHVLFAANSGFVHYKHEESQSERQPLNISMRTVHLINGDSALLGGFGEPDMDGELTLPFAENSLAFTYSSVDCQLEQCLYRYRLVGFRGEKWSQWSSTTLKEFTNLREGEYSFQVQAQDILGNVSSVASFPFWIEPPWYRSSWAYLLYVCLSAMVLVLSASWYRQRQNKEQKKLIDHQQNEIKAKDTALTQLRNDKLEAEISLKKKELASSTMHLIDKNELMGKIKNSVHHIIQHHAGNGALTKDLKSIVKEIDRNLDQDEAWDQFSTSFDEVHDDFLKKLSKEYPMITPADLKLCAYLRMNMSTKEIANLLKISVRGVEIARYRLRKKLQLPSETNLAEFMIKYGA